MSRALTQLDCKAHGRPEPSCERHAGSMLVSFGIRQQPSKDSEQTRAHWAPITPKLPERPPQLCNASGVSFALQPSKPGHSAARLSYKAALSIGPFQYAVWPKALRVSLGNWQRSNQGLKNTRPGAFLTKWRMHVESACPPW